MQRPGSRCHACFPGGWRGLAQGSIILIRSFRCRLQSCSGCTKVPDYPPPGMLSCPDCGLCWLTRIMLPGASHTGVSLLAWEKGLTLHEWKLSEIPQLPYSAAQSASYAQRALEAKSNDEMEEALLRTARAQAEAEVCESRAATAAALATAHQEVSTSQADVAEQVRLPFDPHPAGLRLSNAFHRCPGKRILRGLLNLTAV